MQEPKYYTTTQSTMTLSDHNLTLHIERPEGQMPKLILHNGQSRVYMGYSTSRVLTQTFSESGSGIFSNTSGPVSFNDAAFSVDFGGGFDSMFERTWRNLYLSDVEIVERMTQEINRRIALVQEKRANLKSPLQLGDPYFFAKAPRDSDYRLFISEGVLKEYNTRAITVLGEYLVETWGLAADITAPGYRQKRINKDNCKDVDRVLKALSAPYLCSAPKREALEFYSP